MSIFDFSDYRAYLIRILESERFGRGARARLAELLGTRPSFISIVLHGKQDFALEHAIKIAEFFGLTPDETDYFILLVEYERAGNAALKQYFRAKIQRVAKDRQEIASRVTARAALNESDLHRYFSTWHHTAVHMAIRNPSHQTIDSIMDALKLGREETKSSVELLVELGFAKMRKGCITPTERRFHEGKKSPALRSHHTNWRISAIRSLDAPKEPDLHYSLICSVDAPTAERIRKTLLETIEAFEPLLVKARDEEVHAFCVDFFRVL